MCPALDAAALTRDIARMVQHPGSDPAAEPAPDVLILGAGLAGGLIALALQAAGARLLLLEQAARPGGNHTWSLHATDLVQAAGTEPAWLEGLIGHRWAGQQVRFPGFTRSLSTGYGSIASADFARILEQRLGPHLLAGAEVVSAEAGEVRLRDGRVLRAPLLLDARGARALPGCRLSWQKFLGLEIRTTRPHGLTEPIIMDATVPQRDGFRFIYTLPLDPERLLIEDTYYSDSDDLDPPGLQAGLLAYAASQGWSPGAILREEQGRLPLLRHGQLRGVWPPPPGAPLPVGLRGLFFHPLTGYSLPDALRTAQTLAGLTVWSDAAARAALQPLAQSLWQGRAFHRYLTRLLFEAARPQQRLRILEGFYRLPEPLIRRFYAGGTLPWSDRLRILWRRPPVPVWRAIAAMPGALTLS